MVEMHDRSNKWTPKVVGFVDFWAYDYETYPFHNGKILFRGSNGQGKSVSMQSIIPMLLDGNTHPSRIDPFGTGKRKIIDYLKIKGKLDTGRISYLFITYEKLQTKETITTGIGLRPINESKVDFWGFIVNNVEVNKDFLTRSVGYNRDGEEEFVSIPKEKLKSQINDMKCGKYLDSRKEYAEEVNKSLFQFDPNGVQFKELTKLLIQIRSPKLSKEMKPDVLYEALKNSLGELPSSEFSMISNTIKDIEDRNMKIKKTEGDLELAESLLEGFITYQENMLANASYRYMEAYKRKVAVEKKIEDNGSDLTIKIAELKKISERLTDIEISISTTKTNLNLLETHEVRSYNDDKQNKENEKRKRIDELDGYTQKFEEYEERSRKLKRNIEKFDAKCGDIEKMVKDLSMELDDLSHDIQFAEHGPYQAKAIDNIEHYEKDKLYFNTWLSRLNEHTKFLKEVLNAVEEEMRVETDLKKKKDEIRNAESQIESLDKEILQLNKEFNLEQGNYKVSFKDWLNNNQEYTINHTKISELMYSLESLLDTQETSTDFMEKELFKLKTQLTSNLDYEISLNDIKINNLKVEIDSLLKEKEVIEADREIVPPFRHNKTTAQRDLLKSKDIPYISFYEAVDFLPDITEEQKVRIESALIDMGILDRLIVPSEYQTQIGENNAYLFPDDSSEKSKKSLISALSVVVPNDCSISEEEIKKVLNSISIETDGSHTYLTLEGEFRHGLIKGNAVQQDQAIFIGKEARRRYKEQKVKEIVNTIHYLKNQTYQLEETKSEIEIRKNRVENEYSLSPSLKRIDGILFDKRVLAEKEKELMKIKEKLDIALADLLKDFNFRKSERIRISANLEGPKDIQTLKSLIDLSENDYKDGLRDLKQHLVEYELNRSQHATNRDNYEIIEEDIVYYKGQINSTKSRIEVLKKEIEILVGLLKDKGAAEIEEKINQLRTKGEALEKEQKEKWKQQPIVEKDIENINGKIEELKLEKDFLVNLLKAREEILELEIRSNNKTLVDNTLYEFAMMYSNAVNVSEIIHEFYTKISTINAMGLEDYSLTSRDGVIGKYQMKIDDYPTKKEHLEILSSDRKRLTVTLFIQGTKMNPLEFYSYLENLKEQQSSFLKKSEEDLIKNVMIQGLGEKIRDLILKAKAWKDEINAFMKTMNNSIELRLLWDPIDKADGVDSLTTSRLVELLGRDISTLKDSDIEAMSKHFMTKINIAKDRLNRKNDNEDIENLEQALKLVLDYRDWYKFKIRYTLEGDEEKTLDETSLSILSGGEKAMAIYIPLFSAAFSKYTSASSDAPYMIALDEAFAGVDEDNISEMFALMEQFGFDYILTSQSLWADYPTVSGISIYDLTFDKANFFVFSEPWIWNGKQRVINMDVRESKGMYLNEDDRIEGEPFQDDLFSFTKF